MKKSILDIEHKIVKVDTLLKKLGSFRKQGKKIGFTNGCFDCCHLGHIHSIREARRHCDVLVVGLNTDKWIRKHKGADRPIQNEKTRAMVLASFSYVDFVVLFGSETALPLVKKLRPDIIAKEGYPLDKWPEGRFVQSNGGKAITISRLKGCSTTLLANHMKLA